MAGAGSAFSRMSDTPDIKFRYKWSIENFEKMMDAHYDIEIGEIWGGGGIPREALRKIISPTFIIPQFPNYKMSIELCQYQDQNLYGPTSLQRIGGERVKISRILSITLGIKDSSFETHSKQKVSHQKHSDEEDDKGDDENMTKKMTKTYITKRVLMKYPII